MPQSLSQVYIHLIFSTKKRFPYLVNPIVQQKIYNYIKSICHKENCNIIAIGGVEDHIHILMDLHKNLSISKLVEKIKKSSSKWIKTLNGQYGSELLQFHWQHGYAAFSVSLSSSDAVKNYIKNQATHHKQRSFQEELRTFLKKYSIPYKEEYIWD